MTKIKICGIKTTHHANSAINNGADFIGMVFYKESPRNITPKIAANINNIIKNSNAKSVALTANPNQELLDSIINLKPHYIQFHGDETENFIRSIKPKLNNIKIIKTIKINNKNDTKLITETRKYADLILLDAKPSDSDKLPGGNAKSFNWELIKDQDLNLCLLAGGLNHNNVKQAINTCQPYGVDVSSGVEKSLGVKCSRKIKQFIRSVQEAN